MDWMRDYKNIIFNGIAAVSKGNKNINVGIGNNSQFSTAENNNELMEILDASRRIGFLSGDEVEAMTQAHIQTVLSLATPFAHEGIYDFSKQTTSKEVLALIPVMLKHRLKHPPEYSYSLHRKLSGAFLLCSKLNAQINCKELIQEFDTDAITVLK